MSVQLVSKISNLCGPDPPTSPTDRQTDDMRSQDHVMHYSASRGKNYIVELYIFPTHLGPQTRHWSHTEMILVMALQQDQFTILLRNNVIAKSSQCRNDDSCVVVDPGNSYTEELRDTPNCSTDRSVSLPKSVSDTDLTQGRRPQFTHRPSLEIIVFESEPLTITCIVEGNPKPHGTTTFSCWYFCNVYRAMHFSAKRGIPIVYCLSVCPSVRLWRWGTVIT